MHMHCAYPYAHCVHLLAHCKHASLSTLIDCIYEKMQLRVAAKHHDRDAQRIPLWAYASYQGKQEEKMLMDANERHLPTPKKL